MSSVETTTSKRLPGRPVDEALQQRRREEILDRAVEMFAQHGFRETDLQWVAKACGVSKGTIYHYFISKEELFLTAVRRGVKRLHETIDAAKFAMTDPVERIERAVEAYLRFFKENPALVELFIQERAEFKDRQPIYF